MPAVAADAADVASLWQLDKAVRMVVNLVPVQLEPITVRLVRAFSTLAASAPLTFKVSLFESYGKLPASCVESTSA